MPSAASSMDLIDCISRNDPELQYLHLSSDSTSSNANEVAAALTNCKNTHIRRVSFRNFKVGDDDLRLLIQASVQLVNLQGLSFHCTELPVSLLTWALKKNNSKISAVGLRYCQLKCDTDLERQEFHTTLQDNTSLQELCVECCEWQQTEPRRGQRGPQQTSLLDSICGITSLRHLEWCARLPSPQAPQAKRLPPSTLERICQISTLQTLRLRNVWLPQEDVARLCLSACLCRLQKLILSLDLGNTSAHAMAQLLHNSSSLQHLALRIDRLVDPGSPTLLAQALMQHSGLEHFHLSGKEASQISNQSKAAFTEMMQTNTRLEFVRLDVSDYALQSDLAFYLQLNHNGRRELFQKLQLELTDNRAQQVESRHSWVQALCRNATDLRALHYFLSLHPALFATAALEAQQMHGVVPQQAQQHCTLQHYEWDDADEGIVYDSDGW